MGKDTEPRRISRRDLLKVAAAGAGALGLSAVALLEPAQADSTEQRENINPSKFRGVLAWGSYRGEREGERKSVIGFDTQGAKASGTANTWDGQKPTSFTDKDQVSATVDFTNVDIHLDGKYNTRITSYWNNKVSPENGPTFYFEINPEAVPEERYTVRVLNTSGKEPRIYFQSKHVESTMFYNEFRGASVDVEIRTTDKDGIWNTVGGLFLGENKDIAEAFKAKNAQYSQ